MDVCRVDILVGGSSSGEGVQVLVLDGDRRLTSKKISSLTRCNNTLVLLRCG